MDSVTTTDPDSKIASIQTELEVRKEVVQLVWALAMVLGLLGAEKMLSLSTASSFHLLTSRRRSMSITGTTQGVLSTKRVAMEENQALGTGIGVAGVVTSSTSTRRGTRREMVARGRSTEKGKEVLIPMEKTLITWEAEGGITREAKASARSTL